jgi:hypothetical protein
MDGSSSLLSKKLLVTVVDYPRGGVGVQNPGSANGVSFPSFSWISVVFLVMIIYSVGSSLITYELLSHIIECR